MFTGIVEEKGRIAGLARHRNLCVLEVASGKVFRGTKIGDSIAVNGVCLTVSKKERHRLLFEVMRETLFKTTLKDLRVESPVNLERALKAASRFGGHLVCGHVDGIGTITRIVKKANSVEFQISLPTKLARFLVSKGSVGVDGVSLTVGEVEGNRFSIYLIPYTLKKTTLGDKKLLDRVNIETDLIAKYLFYRRKRPLR